MGDHDIERLVAHELARLGFPAQRCDIQASYLTFQVSDLAVRIELPLTLKRQGRASGVIQIGAKLRNFHPVLSFIIRNAKGMGTERLAGEVGGFINDGFVAIWQDCERKGVEWPHEWPKPKVKASV